MRVRIGHAPDLPRALRKELMVNPHDRRARFELADLLIAQRQPAEGLELLKANVEQGEEDAPTLHLMAVALLATGHPERAERLIDAAEEAVYQAAV